MVRKNKLTNVNKLVLLVTPPPRKTLVFIVYPMLLVSVDCPIFDCPIGVLYHLLTVKEVLIKATLMLQMNLENLEMQL